MIRFFCFIFIIVFICSNISSSQSIEKEYNKNGVILYKSFRFPRCYYRYIKNVKDEGKYWLIEFITQDNDDEVSVEGLCEEQIKGMKI